LFGIEDLKETTAAASEGIECPVKGCGTSVPKMIKEELTQLDSHLDKGAEAKERFGSYLCPNHEIYVTPSRFIYSGLRNNLLWPKRDITLMKEIMKNKRVRAQLYHDNSEDAVTWNIFRYLERSGLIDALLSCVSDRRQNCRDVIYWSHSREDKGCWAKLNEAREEFGEDPEKGSEPDVIILTDQALFLIEAKLTATDKATALRKAKKYEAGGGRWFWEVFDPCASLVRIAALKELYQLMRFWLLGSWIADKLDLDFYLINLTLSREECEIEQRFGKHIIQSQRRCFLRETWEAIYRLILRSAPPGKDKDTILKYFRNKSLGYPNGKLRKAFHC